MQVFNGDLAKYRGWLFDLLVAIGTADRGLANEIRRFMKEKAAHQVNSPKFSTKDWDPSFHEVDTPFNQEYHSKYSGELFGVLVQLTEGEAKSASTELALNGGGVGADDGYQGLLLLQNRFDNQTTSSLLQLFCEVITPGGLKFKDIVTGIHSWERRIALLETKLNESITENIKLAVLIGMLPKDYQNMAMQNVGLMLDMKYKEIMDYIIIVATQKMSMYKPTPMETHGV